MKNLLIGAGRSLYDSSVFHKVSLVAFFAWIGMGADGLSSSCYGPEEAFKALGAHHYLGLFVALLTVFTIIVISTSYSQIIEVFPSGGGGYVVASKLLSPRLGMVAGCALMVDYVLTVTTSVVAGVVAIFSFLPASWQAHTFIFPVRVDAAIIAIVVLTLMNLRGVRESVAVLAPVFMAFVITHIIVIAYTFAVHSGNLGQVAGGVAADVQSTSASQGTMGMIFLILFAYSMGAGTFTGIEAVANGLPMLREPRVQTGKRTMVYMWVSLSIAVLGLMLGYLLFDAQPEAGKTLNAVLMGKITESWGAWGQPFAIVTLLAEAAVLFVAAQSGFIGGPRVLANMAMDRWMPARFSMLSDRLVTQNGILMMSAAAVIATIATGASVDTLLLLYAINVFITFLLSQMGMVRHWWQVRATDRRWHKGIIINGVGMMLTLLILVWNIISKFDQGGWVTLAVTGSLIVVVSLIRRHYTSYRQVSDKLNKFADMVVSTTQGMSPAAPGDLGPKYDSSGKTAVLLVSGFNGFGMHTLLNIFRFFGDSFRNYVFLHVGVVDAGNFKGAAEVQRLSDHIRAEVDRYVDFVRKNGYYAEGITAVGTDVADEVDNIAPEIIKRFPQAVFFAGQLVFPQDSILTRWLHNNIAFAIQHRLYRQGVPFVILPTRV
jgi:amino acid transporter